MELMELLNAHSDLHQDRRLTEPLTGEIQIWAAGRQGCAQRNLVTVPLSSLPAATVRCPKGGGARFSQFMSADVVWEVW